MKFPINTIKTLKFDTVPDKTRYKIFGSVQVQTTKEVLVGAIQAKITACYKYDLEHLANE